MAATSQVSHAMEAAIAVSRFGLGARPGELAAASSHPHAWLKAQITTAGADQPSEILPSSRDRFAAFLAFRAEVRTLRQEAAMASANMASMNQASADEPAALPPSDDAAEKFKAGRRLAIKPLHIAEQQEILARARLAAGTSAPFRERWALFWANHFTVSTRKPKAAVLAGCFEREAIRPHVFGGFEELLIASSTHPGMLMYLDQNRSAGPNSLAGLRRDGGLNENLAREILELHTVGADAGFTQTDVTELARALTGYSIGLAKDGPDMAGVSLFRPNLHEPGVRKVLGREYAQHGAMQARAILADLAANPHTAGHLARKLAIHFVADAAPEPLITRLRDAYIASDGDLAVMAATLIDAPEAWDPAPRKFKRPYEFLISCYRAAGLVPVDAGPELIQPLTTLGERPFSAPQPNGWSDETGDWAAPDAIIRRLNWASGFAAKNAPVDVPPPDLAEAALGERLTPQTKLAIARAESREEALTLLIMSPEFQRR